MSKERWPNLIRLTFALTAIAAAVSIPASVAASAASARFVGLDIHRRRGALSRSRAAWSGVRESNVDDSPQFFDRRRVLIRVVRRCGVDYTKTENGGGGGALAQPRGLLLVDVPAQQLPRNLIAPFAFHSRLYCATLPSPFA